MGLPWIWIGGIVASAVVSHQVLKPRLPVYRIEPLLGRLPKITWSSDKFLLGVPMSVSMHNDNFVEIDVYSLLFDMFYMSNDGSLLHVTDIKDHNQAPGSRRTRTATDKLGEDDSLNSTKEALWQIPCRANFTINDMLYVGLDSGLLWNLLGNLRFYSSLWRGSGSFWLPTTGVAHVKATNNVTPGIPATIRILCDNLVEGMVVQGLSCVLHDAQPGWADIEEAAESLRSHAISKLRANEDGTVVQQQQQQQQQQEEESNYVGLVEV